MATWKPENVLLTLKGNEALSKVLAGQGKLTVTRIVAGAGYVSPSTLYNQKDVSNIKQTLEVNRVVTDANGSEISTTLSNINLDTAYSLYQIGVYCKHTDSDEEFLYLIAQCETDKPDNIPAKTDTVASFSYNLYIQHEGTTQFEVTVNQPGAISVSMLGKPNGVATLDSSGKVPSGQIPSLEYAAKKHASQHATGGSDPITPASIGAAPAGYGLGEVTPTLISNCNTARNGWYRVDASTVDIPDVGLTNGVLRIDEANEDLIRQSLYFCVPGKVHKMERVHFNGTWYPWEWVNPPMASGIEYRTTERYKEKSVYKKLDTDGVIKWRVDGETTWHSDKPISKSVTLSASGWDSAANTQTVTVSGVLADETKQLITPAPALASQTAYYEAVVLCTGQAANQLTFTAKKIPTADLTVYVTIQEVST